MSFFPFWAELSKASPLIELNDDRGTQILIVCFNLICSRTNAF